MTGSRSGEIGVEVVPLVEPIDRLLVIYGPVLPPPSAS